MAPKALTDIDSTCSSRNVFDLTKLPTYDGKLRNTRAIEYINRHNESAISPKEFNDNARELFLNSLLIKQKNDEITRLRSYVIKEQ